MLEFKPKKPKAKEEGASPTDQTALSAPIRIGAPPPTRPPLKIGVAPPTPEDTEQKAAARRESTYTVKAGDTLRKLALHHYGDAAKADELYEANKDVIPAGRKLKAGMMLKLL